MTNEELFRPFIIHYLKNIMPKDNGSYYVEFSFKNDQFPNISAVEIYKHCTKCSVMESYKGMFGINLTKEVEVREFHITVCIKDEKWNLIAKNHYTQDNELLELLDKSIIKSHNNISDIQKKAREAEQEKYRLMIKNTVGEL